MKTIARMLILCTSGVHRRPQTTTPAQGHRRYPYLLKDLSITAPNQVWAADITYIPMGRGFLYLVAIMDWHSRYVLFWRLCNTLEAEFCVEALEEALVPGQPEIFNSDQGSKFTGDAFTGMLEEHGIRISMDARGSYSDNLFIERLWRTVKYEEVYLNEYRDGREAKKAPADHFRYYNNERPNQGLRYCTPSVVYRSRRFDDATARLAVSR